jgi:radical SAM-linked protein
MKVGRAACISHLDLQRALLRGLRSSGNMPAYSAGFNPHPKLSLALPLPLGFESLCEYLEVTLKDGPPISVDELNRVLPEGLVVTGADARQDGDPASRKPLASRIGYAEYDIVLSAAPRADDGERIGEYLAQERIFTEKTNRKKGGTDIVDIRPMIRSFTSQRKAGDRARYACTLSASTGAVLNPLTLIRSFYAFCGVETDFADAAIVRTNILIRDG